MGKGQQYRDDDKRALCRLVTEQSLAQKPADNAEAEIQPMQMGFLNAPAAGNRAVLVDPVGKKRHKAHQTIGKRHGPSDAAQPQPEEQEGA